MSASSQRPATDKEAAIIASFRTPTVPALAFFGLFCLSMSGFFIFLSARWGGPSAFGYAAAPAILLLCVLILRRGNIALREAAAMQVMDTEGRIERVFRGKGGLVGAIVITGIRYIVMDAEPVSEETKVRIAFLPRTRRIVTLERTYDLASPDAMNRGRA